MIHNLLYSSAEKTREAKDQSSNRTNIQLTYLIRTETGNKPYKCNECNKSSNVIDIPLPLYLRESTQERNYRYKQ